MFFKREKNGKRHRHEFRDFLKDELAYWSKRNQPEDKVYFRGTLRKCAGCPQLRFKAPGLLEVEVTE